MKRCPKCNYNYSDDTLEFCLEDGTQLAFTTNYQTETPTITIPNKSEITTAETVNLPFSNPAKNMEFIGANDEPTILHNDSANDKFTNQGYKILEVAPIVASLTHNWWQWLYLNNQYYSSFSSYVLSANFLMWLVLLAAGAGVGLYSVKNSRNKTFAITGLIILAINLILFLVPKR